MAIIGIGTDIVKVSRIKRMMKKYPESFAGRILHKHELQIYQQHRQPISFLAKRFAVKEALAKALGTGIAQGVSFVEIEVSNNQHGQPQLTLHGATRELANKLGVKQHFVSLSDEDNYAIAMVLLEAD